MRDAAGEITLLVLALIIVLCIGFIIGGNTVGKSSYNKAIHDYQEHKYKQVITITDQDTTYIYKPLK